MEERKSETVGATDTQATPPTPPKALMREHKRVHHGHVVVDKYEWLREKDSPDTRAYLAAENEYTDAKTAHLKPLQESIVSEIKSRTEETDMSVPVRSGNWWYYGRSEEGKSYGISCRIPATKTGDVAADWTPPTIDGVPENEQIILDSNVLAEGFEFFSLGASSITVDGNFLAYSTDTSGDERFDLRIKDLRTGEILPDVIENIGYGATWVGSDWLFYERVDESWRPCEIWRHKVGTSADDDVCVFREEDEKFWLGLGTTRSERYLIVEVGSKVTSEVWYLDLLADSGELAGDRASLAVSEEAVTSDFKLILPRQEGIQYEVDHAVIDGEDFWIVVHNAHGPDFEVATAPVGDIHNLDDCEVVIDHQRGRRIEGVDVFSDYMMVGYRENATNRMAIAHFGEESVAEGNRGAHGGASSGARIGEVTPIDFDEELYSVGLAGNPEWVSPYVRMSYESFTTPALVFDFDVATSRTIERKRQIVKGGYIPDDYCATRMWTTARDGAQVPVSVIARADVDLNSVNPMVLYGYGSYEVSVDPAFSIARLSLLDRGVVFVVAHIRGGGEMGRSWYDTGKTLTKKNTFYDFIDVADDLIARGMTDSDHLVATGGSAGGLLMGAIANMAGDRFAGIEAVVPFVDPLTSILMPELPLTVVEWDEWGDPLHDPSVYEYMASYAPYDNISADHVYPPIMAITSLNDTRVLYVEPAKWVAKLREVVPEIDACLKVEMQAGHGGVSGRYDRWRQTAFEYAWLIEKAGAAK